LSGHSRQEILMTRVVALAALAGALTLTACDGFGQAMTSHTDVLARAGGHELPADSVTAMLVPATRIPPQAEVVDAVANLWIDYTLLGMAMAEDSTLQNVDLDGIIIPFFNQQLVYELRDRVIQVDTAITDEELRRLFDTEQPNAEVRARHILFRMPADAAPQVRDSVMTRARQVLQQAKGGADFAQLASQFTEEPGGADRGGDLGYFGPGSMVQPFEEAAFRLGTGEVSDLVETPFGIHIIKVEDKRLPDFESMKAEFRETTIQNRYAQAEDQYLTQLTDGKQLEVQEGAIDVARELARRPNSTLNRRQAARSMVQYTDGSLTAGEYLVLMQQRPAQQRSAVSAANDEQLRDWLRLLARDEILIEEAKKQGLSTPAAEQDSARMQLRQQMRDAAREAGLLPVTPAGGENAGQAVQRQVLSLLKGIVNGERNVVQLGAATFTLREKYGAEVIERAIPTVVAQIQERRPPEQQPPEAMPLPPGTEIPMPQTPPTTGGN
jgi:hypothetical protein